MSLSTLRGLAFVAVGFFALGLRGAELPIVAKARAFLGSESVLNCVQSIHYVGTLVTTDPKDEKKQTRAAIEIIVVKPDRYRVTITSDTTIETTALDGYDAWSRVASVSDRSKWQQTLQGGDGVKRLRANTRENILFFRGAESEGGAIEDLGPTTVNGVRCQKVAFVYSREATGFKYFDAANGRQIYASPNVVFTRYFDSATGRLVHTETEGGVSIDEQGDIVVNGLRFPKSIITVTKNQAGQTQTVTITFDKITLNEKFPDGYFSVPLLKSH